MSVTLPAGALVLTPGECQLLVQIARISELRTRHRIGDTRAYQLLTAISVAAYQAPAADIGISDRHVSASEEREYWTVTQVAKQSGRSVRKVRNDCESGYLPAKKLGRPWHITDHDARTYIDSHRN